MKNSEKVTVFYACDDRYIPCLSVSLLSLIENADKNTEYRVVVLNSGLKEENKAHITRLAGCASDSEISNVSVSFVDVSEHLRTVADQLSLRDYYSLSIYFRIFIPSLFPEIEKAIYLDADTVLLSDVALLYRIELGDHLLAAASDAVVASEEVFRRYADEGVGIPYNRYFNSGVMVMNLCEMRKCNLQKCFTDLLNTYHFNTICPDQDYLNVICRDRVLYIGSEWNKMTVDHTPCEKLHLIHYNMFFKPWLYEDVTYGEYFWDYASRSPFYEKLLSDQANFGESGKRQDAAAGVRLRETASAITGDAGNFRNVLLSGE